MAISFDPNRSDIDDSSAIAASKTVSTSQIEACVSSSPLDKRQTLIMFNNGPQIIYYGPSGITSATGIPIFKNQMVSITVGPSNRIYLVTATSTATVVIQEVS